MNAILPWIFLAPLAGLVVTALGAPRRAGLASLPGPLLVLLAGALHLVSGGPELVVRLAAVPFLHDGDFVLRLDALAAVMLVLVGAVATCVYLYSRAYMDDDVDVRRFFCFLDAFLAAMSLLLLSGNLLTLLCGWTGVGLMSFLLISFWWKQEGTLKAGALALGANAIGDAALLAAAVLVPAGGGDLTRLGDATVLASVPGGALTLGALLVIAAAAKSAQGPLFFWLPSAMAGPTPVSALIHAATMVAAGVYLLVRSHALVLSDEVVMLSVALLGIVTAVAGGIASLWQQSLKRGLAYSTVSQLGYMFAAVGVGAPFAALFHLITHASFKALLFLTSGVVLHTTNHDDLRSLGGLKKRLPGARLAFLVGSAALIGVPFVTAGAFSKDAILVAALDRGMAFGGALLFGVLLTGLYIGRLYFRTFEGAEGEASSRAVPAVPLLLWPLLPLAIGAVGLGYLEGGTGALSSLLAGEVPKPTSVLHVVPDGLGLGAALLGAIGFALGRFVSLPAPPEAAARLLEGTLRLPTLAFSRVANGAFGRYAGITLAGVAGVALLVLTLALAGVSLGGTP